MNVAQFYPIFQSSRKVTIDSRTIAGGDIFFAFSGGHQNGAQYAQQAIESGAVAVIVEDEQYADEARSVFFVPSTLAFLQELARYHRNQLTIPVIGLTGSNGKTTTKELMHAVLAKRFKVQYTHGNLNNHIGVPLTLLSIRPEHELAIIEMGANHQHEIELLCSIAQPTLGYITNFGKAHLEGFGGFQGVVKGKSELYDFLKQNGQVLLLNEDDAIQREKAQNYEAKVAFGTKSGDYIFSPFAESTYVGVEYEGRQMLSQLTGAYNFTNLCAAAALGLHFGVEVGEIAEAIERYTPTNMRSQILKKKGKTFVLDTYNANPSSMAASLQNFAQFEGSKTIIIGDMLELGDESAEEHITILNLAHSLGFDEIITVGDDFKSANSDGEAYLNAAELAKRLAVKNVIGENVLLKGSRGIALETVLDAIV